VSVESLDVYETRLADLARRDHFRSLLREPTGVSVKVEDRHGLAVLTAEESALAETGTLEAFRRFRLREYLNAGMVDRSVAADAGWLQEPEILDTHEDIHILAVTSGSARLAACLSLHRPDPSAAPRRMEERDRPLLTVEATYGWGIYGAIDGFCGLRLGEMMEIKRLACDKRLRPTLGQRALVEVLHELVRTAIRQASTIKAYVGDLVPVVLGRRIDALGVPWHVIDVRPPRPGEPGEVRDEAEYCAAHYRTGQVRPFLILIDEVVGRCESRLEEVDAALNATDAEFRKQLLGLTRNRRKVIGDD
jgi:hypothetical protein